MKDELNSIEKETAEKYDVAVSCRIPASLYRTIGDEAVMRQISFSRHLSSLVLTGHKQGSESNAEINILLREKESLQKEVLTYKQKLEIAEQKLFLKTQDEVFFSILRQNRDILKKYASASPMALDKLLDAGFDLSFVTQTVLDKGKQYFCILDMRYWEEKNMIFIKPLNPLIHE